jgi:hypothetical protein
MVAPGSKLDSNLEEEEEDVWAGCPLQVGQVLADKYRIERQIGRGGMGIVLAATHLQLEHQVAIKVMRRDLIEDDKALHRLLAEARACAKIRSEHVARVLDVGTIEHSFPYIVMEYLEGEDLADRLDRVGALEVPQAVQFLLQCCEALAEVHVRELVHRDLKPGNVFLAKLPDGSSAVKIVDFGISKPIGGAARGRAATTTSTVFGSPYYMSPEQMRAEPVDERSDIWALGAILFEMLTGQPPFKGETLPEVYAAVLGKPPVALETLRPSVPSSLNGVIRHCLSKDPGQRFRDVGQLAEALAPFAGTGGRDSVGRVARILTNPDFARVRAVLPETALAVGGRAREGSAAELGAALDPQPVMSIGTLRNGIAPQPATSPAAMSIPAISFPAVSIADALVPLDPRRTPLPAELGPLSATGAIGDRESVAPSIRTRSAWALIGFVVLCLPGAFWWRIRSRPTAQGVAAVLQDGQVGSPSSSERAVLAERASAARPHLSPVPPSTAAVQPVEQTQAVEPDERPHGELVRGGASHRGEEAAQQLRERARRASDKRAPVRVHSRPNQAGHALPEQSAPSSSPEVRKGAPDTDPASLTDPWDPNSFGDRR